MEIKLAQLADKANLAAVTVGSACSMAATCDPTLIYLAVRNHSSRVVCLHPLNDGLRNSIVVGGVEEVPAWQFGIQIIFTRGNGANSIGSGVWLQAVLFNSSISAVSVVLCTSIIGLCPISRTVAVQTCIETIVTMNITRVCCLCQH